MRIIDPSGRNPFGASFTQFANTTQHNTYYKKLTPQLSFRSNFDLHIYTNFNHWEKTTLWKIIELWFSLPKKLEINSFSSYMLHQPGDGLKFSIKEMFQ
jgi:hypothetical protein